MNEEAENSNSRSEPTRLKKEIQHSIYCMEREQKREGKRERQRGRKSEQYRHYFIRHHHICNTYICLSGAILPNVSIKKKKKKRN